MKIYVWRVANMLIDKQYEQLFSFVTNERLERSRRFRREVDACRSLMGETMIRLAAAADLKLPFEAIRFQTGEFGKPELVGIPHYHFNVSHSGDWVVLFTSEEGHRVGIDVEQVGELNWQVAEAVLTDRELADLRKQAPNQQPPYFYRLWTMKECFIKAVGTGLSMPLKDFSILRMATGYIGQGAGAEAFQFRAYQLDNGHKLSACSDVDSPPNCWHTFDLLDV